MLERSDLLAYIQYISCVIVKNHVEFGTFTGVVVILQLHPDRLNHKCAFTCIKDTLLKNDLIMACVQCVGLKLLPMSWPIHNMLKWMFG